MRSELIPLAVEQDAASRASSSTNRPSASTRRRSARGAPCTGCNDYGVLSDVLQARYGSALLKRRVRHRCALFPRSLNPGSGHPPGHLGAETAVCFIYAHRASAEASDPIVELKRNAANEFSRYYRQDLMKKARDAAASRENHVELNKVLDAETNPTMLLGGDEITVSLAGAFEELGLLPEIVAKLTDPKVANARVAVTKTGVGDGMVEHDLAMQRGGGGQDILKKNVEPLARSLATTQKSLTGAKAQRAKMLVDLMNGMYTIEVDGENVLVDAKGEKVDFKLIQSQANSLIDGGSGSR